jgi:DNA-binding response OmpR family regulator
MTLMSGYQVKVKVGFQNVPDGQRLSMTNVRSKVLIVDDDHETMETFARILRLEGHDVRTALDGQMGLATAHVFAPDAIIVDFRMPLMDGLGFITRFRSEERDRVTPIAMVTGDYFLDEPVASELGKLGVLLRFKPLWLDELCTLAGVLLAVPRSPDKPAAGAREPGVRASAAVVVRHSRKRVQ